MMCTGARLIRNDIGPRPIPGNGWRQVDTGREAQLYCRSRNPGPHPMNDDDVAARVYSDPLARWFVTEAYKITDTAQLLKAAGERLVEGASRSSA